MSFLVNEAFLMFVGNFANVVPLLSVLFFILAMVHKRQIKKMYLESEEIKKRKKIYVKNLLIAAGITFILSIISFIIIYISSNAISNITDVAINALVLHYILFGALMLLVLVGSILMITFNFMPEEKEIREKIGKVGKRMWVIIGVLVIIILVHSIIMFSGFMILEDKVQFLG